MISDTVRFQVLNSYFLRNIILINSVNDTFGGYKFNFRILRVTDSNLYPKVTIMIKIFFSFPKSFKQTTDEHLRLTHCSIILRHHESIIPAINAL